MITKKILRTTSNREIHVLDNVVTVSDTIECKRVAQSLPYTLSNNVDNLIEHKKNVFFSHNFTEESFKLFRIIEKLKYVLPDYYNNRAIISARINATFSGNRIDIHTDTSQVLQKEIPNLEKCNAITSLVYLAEKWDPLDGGDTVFCNDSGDTEIAVSFAPNRMVIFDSMIPHKIGISYPNQNEPRLSFVFLSKLVDN